MQLFDAADEAFAKQHFWSFIVGAVLILTGLCVAYFSNLLAGLLITLIGVVAFGVGKMELHFAIVTENQSTIIKNQCTSIELQKLLIAELERASSVKKQSDHGRSGGFY